MTYQLRRLRLHGLIERIPKSYRYRLTDFGFRIAVFCTRTYARILRPGLGLVLPTFLRPYDVVSINSHRTSRPGWNSKAGSVNLTQIHQLFVVKSSSWNLVN
jgi:hypothetical protein